MNKFKKLSTKGSKVYYEYFLFGIASEECTGELAIDADTREVAITRLAERDADGNDIAVHALALARNGYPDEYTFAFC